MDRWYRRAAVVLWPRERAFEVRAEASPAAAMDELSKQLSRGRVAEARKMATAILPVWADAATCEQARGFFDQALRVAEALDDPKLAASLLQPFRIEALKRGQAGLFVALVARYGQSWTHSLLSSWSTNREWLSSRDRLAWIGSLHGLCKALTRGGKPPGKLAAELVVEDRWRWMREAIEQAVRSRPPSRRDQAVAELAKPIGAILKSVELIGADALRDDAVAFLCGGENQPLLPGLVRMLRSAGGRRTSKKRSSPAFDAIRRHCIGQLEARLERPARAEGDWSIHAPNNCRCDLCATLHEFLRDPAKQKLEWPLAKAGRQHVHREIDGLELPVRHETRRVGSPYTLVLSKTSDLFESEENERRSWRSDLDGLT